MAEIQFLTILLVATCFLGGVVSVTDREFEDMSRRVDRLTELFEDQFLINRELKEENAVLKEEIILIKKQLHNGQEVKRSEVQYEGQSSNQEGSYQNTTIEERVALLEIQVVVIQDEVTDLETDVDFLFEEQVIQDERILGVEKRVFDVESRMLDVEDGVEDLTSTTDSLDSRVTVLEENGGGDGNSSIVDLEMRVETLEGTTVDHETRISTTEISVEDLEETAEDHQTRLTVAEEAIQALQMTDVELDARVTALEQNGGGGNIQNDTIAFTAILSTYSTIAPESPVLFEEVLLNEGEGYNSSTGTFTVPPSGDGFYYFSVFLAVDAAEICVFDIEINGSQFCSPNSFLSSPPGGEREPTSCSGVAYVAEGDTVQVVYTLGTDTTPLYQTTYNYHGFTGFRI